MPETLNSQLPPTGVYPHQLGGPVTADQVANHLAENPQMYHPGLDPHMEANGIHVDRSAEVNPLVMVEDTEVQYIESNSRWGELASLPRSEEHGRSHDTLGRQLDANYDTRTPAEKAAIGIVGELGEEAERAAGVMQETTEDTHRGPLTSELTALPEKLQPRIDEAIEASDFAPTAEIRDAITGYYTDHYKLAAVIDKVIDGDITPDDITELSQEPQAQTYAVSQAIRKIVEVNSDPSQREAALREADRLLRGMLFKECAVGATTQNEQEVQVLSDLSDKLLKRVVAEGFASTDVSSPDGFTYWRQPSGSLAKTSDLAKQVREFSGKFWEDTRHAGQLLFHNTGTFKDIALSGYRVMSRTKQMEEMGVFNAQMAVNLHPNDNMHSNAPHWSEGFDVLGYKPGGRNATPGTLAVPMAEVIKTAPYGRNAHYGTVVLKPGREQATTKVTVNETTHSINAGSTDRQGASGLDRVFAADYRARNAANAYKYAIDAGLGTKSKNGNKALQIFTTGEERVYYEGADTYGVGENFPNKVILNYDYVGSADPLYGGIKKNNEIDIEAMNSALDEQVRTLQRQSRERSEYAGRYVVPLRQGVMEFVAEDGLSNDIFAQDQKHIIHSNISAETAVAAEARKRTIRA